MIASCVDRATEDLYHGRPTARARRLPRTVVDAALVKMDSLNGAASTLDLRSPPGNRLEAVAGRRAQVERRGRAVQRVHLHQGRVDHSAREAPRAGSRPAVVEVFRRAVPERCDHGTSLPLTRLPCKGDNARGGSGANKKYPVCVTLGGSLRSSA